MTSANTYKIVALSTDVADAYRVHGGEVYVADSMPGYPCRQCLLDAEIGDELILVSHDPFESDSPYRSPSPIFVHRHPCGAPSSSEELPLQLTRRQLSVRAFDRNEMMTAAALVDGNKLDATIQDLLADNEALQIRIHNAERGCYAATAVRAE